MSNSAHIDPQAVDKKDAFRSTISTVDKAGKRKWIFPRKPTGNYHNARVVLAIIQLGVLFGTPFIYVNGQPLILLNVVERKFILFGFTFWPQDFFILALVFVTSVIAIVLFTVAFGRLFCGWVCPQTVFMEMVFRKIEYLIEGDFTKQKKLDKAEWTPEKIFKKTLKHGIFFGIAILIANTFLAYIIGIEDLFEIISEPIALHASGFVTLIVFSGIFYWIFAWFREQVCLIACPYGRLQGVMLDKNSVVVAYDYERGEPRSKLRKNQERTEGDCIDCMQCVQVCPTGIDIRNGTQIECINCTACIDACNSIMDRIEKLRGLVRYDSENHIANGTKFKFSVRMWAYSALLTVLSGVIFLMIFTRSEVQATILRSRGHLYQKEDNGNYSNIYKASVINKGTREIPLTLQILNKEGSINTLGNKWELAPQGIIENIMIIELAPNQLDGLTTELEIGLFDADQNMVASYETKFLGPVTSKK